MKIESNMKKNIVHITLLILLLVLFNAIFSINAYAQESNPCFSKVINPDGSVILKVNALAACTDEDGNSGKCELLTGSCLAQSKTINSCLTRNFNTDGTVVYVVMGGASCTTDDGKSGKCDPSSGQCVTNLQTNPCLNISFPGGASTFTIKANVQCTTKEGALGKCVPISGTCTTENILPECYVEISPGNFSVKVNNACTVKNPDGSSAAGKCNDDGVCKTASGATGCCPNGSLHTCSISGLTPVCSNSTPSTPSCCIDSICDQTFVVCPSN